MTAETTREIEVLRNEVKFYISISDYMALSSIFEKTMTLDPHAGANKDYWVRSLYFDDMANSSYYEKVSGVNARRKIRLRLYDVQQPKMKIEIKNKLGSRVFKETSFIDKADAMALIDGQRSPLLKNRDPILGKVYYLMAMEHYRPVAVIDYEREAYICDFQHIRITFDKNIRGGMSDFRILKRELNLRPVFDERTVVLEVKFNNFLPEWIRDILSGRQATQAAIGKYCLSRALE